jgi:hypothetical protein
LPHRIATLAAFVGLTVASSAPGATAQEAPLVLEVHGGVAIPTGSFTDGAAPGEGFDAGPSLSVAFLLPGSGWRGLYAGFSQHRFGCEEAGCPVDGRLVATGFDVGIRVAVMRGRPVTAWIRVGAITPRVETVDLGPPDGGVSWLGFGGEVGAGAHLSLSDSLGLVPGVRWAFVGTELPGGSTLDMRYLVAQLAATLSF